MKKIVLILCALGASNNARSMQYLAQAGRYLKNNTHQEAKSLAKNTFSLKKGNDRLKSLFGDAQTLFPYAQNAAKPVFKLINDSFDVVINDNEIGPEAWRTYYKTKSPTQYYQKTREKNLFQKKMWSGITRNVTSLGKSFALNLACSKLSTVAAVSLGIQGNPLALLLVHSALRTGLNSVNSWKAPTLTDYGKNIFWQGLSWKKFSYNKKSLYATIGRSALLGAVTHLGLLTGNTALAHKKYERIQKIIEDRLKNRKYIPVNVRKQKEFVALCDTITDKITKNSDKEKQALENYLLSYIERLLSKDIQNNEAAQKSAFETILKLKLISNEEILKQNEHLLARILKIAIMRKLWDVVDKFFANFMIKGSIDLVLPKEESFKMLLKILKERNRLDSRPKLIENVWHADDKTIAFKVKINIRRVLDITITTTCSASKKANDYITTIYKNIIKPPKQTPQQKQNKSFWSTIKNFMFKTC